MDAFTIESLDAELSDEALAALAEADVVIGVDGATQREFTVFGTPPLESTVNFRKPGAMRIVRVLLNASAGELDKLMLLLRATKGPADCDDLG